MAKPSSLAHSKSSKVTLRQTQGKLTMADLLAATGYNIPTLKRNQEVIGKIIAISPSEILIDIGAKSEGIVFGRELSSVKDLVSGLSVGDTVDAIVLYPENEAGQVVLSLRKHTGEKRWIELENKRTSGENIEVIAIEANRGGVICDWMGIRGFLPSSQITQLPSRLNDLINKKLSVHVIEVDGTTNRLILSQKRPEKKDIEGLLKLLSLIKIGEKFTGVVTAVLPFGVFVEITVEGIEGTEEIEGSEGKRKPSKPSQPSKPSLPAKLEGLVHISEISWEKVDDPSTLFKVGDKVDVMVVVKDETTGRLNLSIKQLAEDPFMKVSGKYAKDQEVTGTISKITPYGAMVTLKDGVDGFIHISKIPPSISWEVGQTVACLVDSVDTKARRITLAPIIKEKPVLYR